MLLQVPYAVQRSPRQIIIADDCFSVGKFPADRVVQIVIKSTEKIFGSMFFTAFDITIIVIIVPLLHIIYIFIIGFFFF